MTDVKFHYSSFEVSSMAFKASLDILSISPVGCSPPLSSVAFERMGPKGFLKVIDNQTLAFADFRGNKQYISTGNLLTDDRIALIMVDYPRQARLKILGRVEIFESPKAADWLDRVRMPGEKAVIERVFVIYVEAYDWNCPQHITPRYTAEEIHESMKAIEKRVQALEQENENLRKELAAGRPHLKEHTT